MLESMTEFDSDFYWESRYAAGMFSGCGSVGAAYCFKRDVINALIRKFQFKKVVDFGCGDGWQIQELEIPNYYGLDVSPTIIQVNRNQYSHRAGFRFDLVQEAKLEHFDLAMSLDVIYHVTRRDQYEEYLKMIFSHSNYTLIYGNFLPGKCDSKHIIYRENSIEIERLGIKTTLLGKYPQPNNKYIGFDFFCNWKEELDTKKG